MFGFECTIRDLNEHLTFDTDMHIHIYDCTSRNCPTIGINEHFNQIFRAKARSLILYAIITPWNAWWAWWTHSSRNVAWPELSPQTKYAQSSEYSANYFSLQVYKLWLTGMASAKDLSAPQNCRSLVLAQPLLLPLLQILFLFLFQFQVPNATAASGSGWTLAGHLRTTSSSLALQWQGEKWRITWRAYNADYGI